MKNQYLIFLLFAMIGTLAFAQQQTSIEEITASPNRFNHEEVIFEGFVTRYVAGTATTSSYYEVQGAYGARIRVNTSGPAPRINDCYIVTGTVTIHDDAPLVIEKRKIECDRGYRLTLLVNPQGGGVVSPVGTTVVGEGNTIELSATANSWYRFTGWTIGNEVLSTNETLSFRMPAADTVITANFDQRIYFIGGVIIILVIIALIIIFFLYRPRKTIPPPPAYEEKEEPVGPQDKETIVIHKDQNYDTIRLQTKAPATVKFIPGELEILNGLDKGKSFMMAGYPTPDGNVATIGRDHDGWQNLVPAERHYAHIRIKDESNTLSRMQAELIQRSGKLYLKNLSKVNPTQVDGEDVPVNEVVEVKPNATIKAGFIEFRYKTK